AETIEPPKEDGLLGLDGTWTRWISPRCWLKEQEPEEIEREVLVKLDLSDMIANPPRRSSHQQKRT
ncbi:MAG: hypothetical protein QF685_11300, partial [Verrucomicrobiota bacterium]|nr:hypothetical protein [Verrucomicrobiota bacterium]